MPIIVEVIEQRKDDAIGYGLRDFQPIKVVTYHLSDEALWGDEAESDGDFLSEAVGVDDDGFERVIISETVKKLIASAGLTDREKAVVKATFWDEADDAAIAKRLKVSPSRVKQLRKAAILKLRLQARRWGLL